MSSAATTQKTKADDLIWERDTKGCMGEGAHGEGEGGGAAVVAKCAESCVRTGIEE